MTSIPPVVYVIRNYNEEVMDLLEYTDKSPQEWVQECLERLIPMGEYEFAARILEAAIAKMPDMHYIWLGLLLCKRKCRDLDDLAAQGLPVEKEPEFVRAMKLAEGEAKANYLALAEEVRFHMHLNCLRQLNDPEVPDFVGRIWLERCLAEARPRDVFVPIYRVLQQNFTNDAAIRTTVRCGAMIHMQKIYDDRFASGMFVAQGDRVQVDGKFFVNNAELDLRPAIRQYLALIFDMAQGKTPGRRGLGWTVLKKLDNPVELVSQYTTVLYRKWAAGSFSRYSKALPYNLASAVTENNRRFRANEWCCPTVDYCRYAKIPELTVPASYYAEGEPVTAWERFIWLARKNESLVVQSHCAAQAQRFAQGSLPEDIMKLLAEGELERLSKGAASQEKLAQMERLDTNDPRTRCMRLRCKTGECQHKEDFWPAYFTLSDEKKNLSKHDGEAVKELDAKFRALQAKIDAYEESLAQLEREDVAFLRTLEDQYWVQRWERYLADIQKEIKSLRVSIQNRLEELAPALEKQLRKEEKQKLREEKGLFGALFGRRG